MFRVGQKVVCVKGHLNDLIEGRIYTISDFGKFMGVIPLYDVEGVNKYPQFAWSGSRFRALVERKTDISFAHEILRKVTKRDSISV